MKYSDFLIANEITHEQVWNLLQTRCEKKQEKEQLLNWWKTGMQKTPSSKEYSRYEKELQTLIEKNTLDEDALFSSTLDSYRNAEQNMVDCPSMEQSYDIEVNS